MRVFVYGYDNGIGFTEHYGVASSFEIAKEKCLVRCRAENPYFDGSNYCFGFIEEYELDADKIVSYEVKK